MRCSIRKISANDILSIVLLSLAYLPSRVVKAVRKDLYLCTERKCIAGDNVWYFYQWAKRHRPEFDCVLILDKEAPQFDLSDKDMIAWGSLKHYIFYLSSRKWIMSTFCTPMPNSRVCSNLESAFNIKPTKYYLKHGILKDSFEAHSYSEHNFRLFCCGAEAEFDYMTNFSDYPCDNLKYTGLARFDDLLQNVTDRRFILIIPTWRKYILDETFTESIYYERYQDLISCPEFSSFLKSNGLTAKFCIHAEYRKFESSFVFPYEEIQPIGQEESIHELIKSASLMITDYSSVFFDAAYIGKPVIYYHFDYDEFRSKHLKEGYFSYEKDGMGPIAHSEDELIDKISQYWNGSEFTMDERYVERANRFFPLRDTHNCERIYTEISKIQ